MLAPNTFVGNRYLIVRTIDGAVYEALDTTANISVALKPIDLSGAGASSIEQLEREARVLRRLRHPLLPAVIGYSVDGAQALLVSEFVAGENLTAALAHNGGPFSADQVGSLAEHMLNVLEYLHRQAPPILHRSVKPQNIIVTPQGQLKLVDLGLAVARAQPPQARPAGTGMGSSLQFMPPEQVQGAALDQRSDIYALAATLYYLLTGALPALAGKRINARLRGQPDPLRPAHEANPQVPPAVSAALAQALALDAVQRPIDVAALRQMLAHPAARPLAESQVPTLTELPNQPAAVVPAAELPPTQSVTMPAAAAEAVASPRLRPRWMLPALISAIGVVLLFVVLALIILRRMSLDPDPVQVQLSTAGPAAATAIVATAAPGALTDAIVATAAPGSAEAPAPTSVPAAPVVTAIEPANARVGAQPVTLTLRGSHFDQVRVARLVSEGGPPLNVAVLPVGDDQATLTIAALPAPLNGEIEYRLEVNGALLDTPTLALRDFIGRRQAAGILPEYAYTERVATNAAGAYTAMRAEPEASSQPIGALRNGDALDILRDEVAGWYQVRVHTSADASQAGAVGWIERWLIDNQEVPPQPTAAPTPDALVFVGKVYSAPTDGAVQCGSAFDSSIYGSVEDARGRGISGAKVRITSGDGRNTYNVTTGKGGVYNVPGLGCTSWVVRLLSVPNAPGGVKANRVNVTNLNGGKFTAAEVRFRLQ